MAHNFCKDRNLQIKESRMICNSVNIAHFILKKNYIKLQSTKCLKTYIRIIDNKNLLK